jgi:16S rRNA (cytosine967-C5)-methyltransferase
MNRFDSRGRRTGRPSHGGGSRSGGSGPSRGGRPAFRPPQRPSTQDRFADARGITFEALGTFENRRAFVSDALEQLFYERSVLPQDKGLATEMSYGIARRLATIDAMLLTVCDRPPEMVQEGLWRLMRIGTYQLAWLQSIPAHAAIHETVELAHRLGQSGWAGFLNAVLRRLQRDILPIDQAGWSSQRTIEELVANPDPCWLPIREAASDPEPVESRESAEGRETRDEGRELEGTLAGHQPSAISHQPSSVAQPSTLNPQPLLLDGLQLRQPVFPDPHRFRAAHWAAAFSYPEWMIDDWCQHFGEIEALDRASWFNSTGRMCLRVNLWKTTREAVLASLEQAGIAATPGRLPESILLANPIPVDHLPGFWEGLVSIQDESAMSAAALLAPKPGWRVLDLCAAPGGKTAHMAEQMRNEGQIIACDATAERLPLISQNCDRLGIEIVKTFEVRMDGTDTPDGPFDAVLIDVPCSNTGVLGKRPEVRWRFVPGELRELIPIQMRLLKTALDRVRPGGRVVYSTCSSDPRENEHVIREVLTHYPNCGLCEQRQHVPGHPVDGGFAGLIVKRDL